MVFEQEQLFAVKALKKNEYLAKIAFQNKASLKTAILMAASARYVSTSLSLNPALKLAYLVPRKGAVELEVSYLGLIDLAKRSGIEVFVDLVYSNDTFLPKGRRREPVHEYDPFATKSERGDLRGGFCMAVMPNGSLRVDFMTKEAIHKSRDASESWKAFIDPNNSYVNSSVWDEKNGWYEEPTVLISSRFSIIQRINSNA